MGNKVTVLSKCNNTVLLEGISVTDHWHGVTMIDQWQQAQSLCGYALLAGSVQPGECCFFRRFRDCSKLLIVDCAAVAIQSKGEGISYLPSFEDFGQIDVGSVADCE